MGGALPWPRLAGQENFFRNPVLTSDNGLRVVTSVTGAGRGACVPQVGHGGPISIYIYGRLSVCHSATVTGFQQQSPES